VLDPPGDIEQILSICANIISSITSASSPGAEKAFDLDVGVGGFEFSRTHEARRT
jgi:hypothetical protein